MMLNKCKPLLICFALTALVSCIAIPSGKENSPKAAWESFSDLISQNDISSAFELTANAGLNDCVSNSELTDMVQKKIAEYYSYSYTSDTHFARFSAWQEMDITFLDMRKVSEFGIRSMIDETDAYSKKFGSYRTSSEIEAAVFAMLNELLLSPEEYLSTEHHCVEFCFDDGVWKPVMSAELYDILSGYSRHVDEVMNNLP